MDSSFFAANRERLIEALGGEALIVLTAYHEMQRSADTVAAFEQEANFLYLTGIAAPEWRAIIDSRHGRAYAVSPEVGDVKHVFDGSLSPVDAKRISGVDEVIGLEEAAGLLQALSKKYDTVHYVDESDQLKRYVDFVLNPAQKQLAEELGVHFKVVNNCIRDVARIRSIKQPQEIALIQKAVDITAQGFRAVRERLAEYGYEYEVEARLSYEFRRVGAEGHAFRPVVAAGEHTCTMHHIAGVEKFAADSLLLIDVGARYDNYCADIARTFVMGSPTKRMTAVHQAVLEARDEFIAACQPGLRIDSLQDIADGIIAKKLQALGVSTKEFVLRDYFPHSIGHGLGIDVHESLGGYEELRPNMVLAVEPGIYIADEGIGVRIEDDILITDSGARNLSGALSTDL